MKRSVLIAAAIAALLPLTASAHKMWLQPSRTVMSGTDPWVTVDAAVSNDLFYFDHVPLRVDNLGNAPVYEPWVLQGQVRDAATGHVLGTQVLLNAAQVQDIIAGRPAHLDTTWTLPNSAPAGQYALHLAWVRTPALAAGQPMRWNMAGTEPDGSLRVATLKRN